MFYSFVFGLQKILQVSKFSILLHKAGHLIPQFSDLFLSIEHVIDGLFQYKLHKSPIKKKGHVNNGVGKCEPEKNSKKDENFNLSGETCLGDPKQS